MLIDFSVTNFRSINEKQVFSMQTVGKVNELNENALSHSGIELLRSVIILGRNASGKSNLMVAMDTLSRLILSSITNLGIAYNPFKLNKINTAKPVEFEITFIAKDNIKYRYEISFDSEKIHREALFFYPEKKQAKLFLREFGEKISIGDSFKGNIKDVEEKLYQSDTLLSRVLFHKIESLIEPFAFFNRHFVPHTYMSSDDKLMQHFNQNILNTTMPQHLENVSKLLRIADIGIKSIEVKEFKKEDFNLPKEMDEAAKNRIYEKNRLKVFAIHEVFDDKKLPVGTVGFDIKEESSGTLKLISLGSVMLDCLSDGDVLFIDELDKGLHPLLTRALIMIFNNPKTNPNNAQLIFVSHDVSLLNGGLFRRDQIWFADKDANGSTEYYSLADINGVRKDIPLEKHYLSGAFGATPVINEYDFEFNFERNVK